MNFKSWLLSEEIFPNKTAVVYHRTNSLEKIQSIVSSGYIVGYGEGDPLYGNGLYTTFDINSQFTEYMQRYGDYLLKFKVTSLEKYLILSKQVAKYVLGKNYKISDQLNRLLGKHQAGLQHFGWLIDDKEKLKELDEKQESLVYTSELFKAFYDENKWIEKLLHGVIYRGQNDGYCLLKYHPVDNSIILLGYAKAPLHVDKQYLKWETSTKSIKIKNLNDKMDQREKKSELNLDHSIESLKYASKKGDLSYVVNFLRTRQKWYSRWSDAGNNTSHVDIILNNWPLLARKQDDITLIEAILKNKKTFNEKDIESLLKNSILVDKKLFVNVAKKLGKNLERFSIDNLDNDYLKNLYTSEAELFLKTMAKYKPKLDEYDLNKLFDYLDHDEAIAIVVNKNQAKLLLDYFVNSIRRLNANIGKKISSRLPDRTELIQRNKENIKKVLELLPTEDKEYYSDFVKNSLENYSFV